MKKIAVLVLLVVVGPLFAEEPSRTVFFYWNQQTGVSAKATYFQRTGKWIRIFQQLPP